MTVKKYICFNAEWWPSYLTHTKPEHGRYFIIEGDLWLLDKLEESLRKRRARERDGRQQRLFDYDGRSAF